MDDNTKKKVDALNAEMGNIPQAYSGQGPTNMGEIRNEKKRLTTASQIQNTISESRAKQWYPAKNEDSEKVGGNSAPIISRLIDTSLTPLYGVAGAVDYATGQSKSKSLGAAINANINTEKRTFGDITGNGVLGLTADIILDPINWMTAGTTALVPRMAVGLSKGAAKGGVKGAAKGLAAAAESRVLESFLMTGKLAKGTVGVAAKASSYLNPLRYTNKLAGKPLAQTARDTAVANKSKFMEFIEGRSVKAMKSFDEIVGSTPLQRMAADKTPVGLMWRKGIQDLATRAINKNPAVADYFGKYWKYSNADWTRVSQLKDALLKTSGGDLDKNVKAYIRSFDTGEEFTAAMERILPTMREKAAQVKPSLAEDPFARASAMPAKTLEERQKIMSALSHKMDEDKLSSVSTIMNDMDEGVKVAEDAASYITGDHVENGLRLAAEKDLINLNNSSGIWDDLQMIIKNGDMGESGIKWWDDTRRALRTYEVKVKNANKEGVAAPLKERVGSKVAKILDVYEAIIATFKRGAVGASPTAWTNAVFGNLVMAKMAGIDVLDPAFFASIGKANKIIGNKKGSELLLNELFDVAEILPYLRNNPTAFEATTGLKGADVDKVIQARQLIDKFRQSGIDAGILPKDVTRESVLVMATDMVEEGSNVLSSTAKNADMLVKEAAETIAVRKASKGAYMQALESMDEAGKVAVSNSTSYVAQELFDSTTANLFFNRMAKNAEKEGNYGAKLGNLLFNKMPDEYGKLDYRYKLGSIFYSSVEGVKEGELRIISRLLNLSDEDITSVVIKDGVQRFKLSPAKAMELANEAFLNYAAMPAMVKMLRHLPLVGAPFASFTYGMYTKTARTALTNPAVFNKTALAMSELQPEKTPIEKGLLTMDRYEYLNDDAMVKIPFFGNNMVFMNLANMIPYYSLNMFQPPQRNYEATLPNALIQTMDRLPIMQDPAGSVIFDYFLLPHLLGEELPKGTFGQTLYPEGSTFLEKSKYAGRSLLDPLVPGITQPFIGGAVGLGENAGVLPEGTTQMLPGYRARSFGEGVQGNTSVGVQSKEPAAQRTLRNISAVLGFPVQTPVPHSYLDEKEFISNNKQ